MEFNYHLKNQNQLKKYPLNMRKIRKNLKLTKESTKKSKLRNRNVIEIEAEVEA